MPDQGIYSLRGGTVDDKKWIYPVAHIWQSSKSDWLTPPQDALLYDGQPTDYTPIIEAYREHIGLD